MNAEICTLYTKPCELCGKVESVEVKVKSLRAYREGRLFVQDAFPELSPGLREHLFLSGMCDDCFNLTFSEDEDWFEEEDEA